jgi:N-glycosylase/DNA lyase
MSQTFFIETPKNFNFKRTALSHGWCELRPFEFDQENWILTTVLNAPQPISAKISEAENQIKIEVAEKVDAQAGDKIKRDVAHIFRFDDNLEDFYRMIKTEKHLAWVIRQKAGRLLRSTTVFEDLVKSICTTNCSWSLTKIMVTNLVEKLGATASDGKKAFPTAEAMAKMSEDFYRTEIRAGYRAPYFVKLAEKIATGELKVENWFNSDLSTRDLKKEIKRIKGVGDYAAENLLKLLGRYDGLALDSWLRGQFYKKYNGGNACEDKQIQLHYKCFGKWRGLVIWCEMTEKWI